MTFAHVQLYIERVELMDELNWLRTSAQMSLTANVNRSSSSPVIQPSEFNPYARDKIKPQPVNDDAVAQFAKILNRG